MPDDTKGSHTITIANGLDEKVYVAVEPLDLVRQAEAREKHIGVGVDISGLAGNVNFDLGQANLRLFKSERQSQSVYPHSLWEAPAAMSSLGKKGKSANVSNSIQVRVFTEVTREGSSEKVELGEGYLVGPGHGIIVSKIKGQYKVEQALSRSWRRRYNPWLTNRKVTRDPHAKLGEKMTCPMCED
eukprot:TRINITY_DN9741_c0_g2_i1.p1 TRINITY_DN9741_c0_g2~~TRINITY_DN9741_c0_g2_i1.p1  ORF type:complete len:207 (-),score=38.01 TRINITY_DN9741_c0_g2_i1:35-592(-)